MPHVDVLADFTGQRRHASVGHSAWNDHREIVEVRVDVHGNAVHGDPSAAADPHRTYFSDGAMLIGSDPHPRFPFDPRSFHPKLPAGPNNRLFQFTKISVDIGIESIEIQNQIYDLLSRAMKRDIAPSVDLVVRDSALDEFFSCDKEILGSATLSKREYRRVLDG